MASKLDVRLTQAELAVLRKQLDRNGDGYVSANELRVACNAAIEERTAREIALGAIEKPTTFLDHVGRRVLTVLEFGGTALFAVVGTQLAGDVGMNLVGCTLVGCAAAMGGGTLNNILYASSSPLVGKPGVFWVRCPKKLILSIVASVATFFAWPIYCEHAAKRQFQDVIDADSRESDGTVGEAAFVATCQRDPDFLERVRAALPEEKGTSAETLTLSELFQRVDVDGSGSLDLDELQALVVHEFDTSPTMYALDTAALTGLAISAVHGAIGRGLHPVVAATSGVTVCFGGILRDVLCGRDLAIGGQSYAFATGSGAFVYVMMRELTLRGLPMPLIGHIVLAGGTTVALRAWEFARGEPLLAPMHERRRAQQYRGEKASEQARNQVETKTKKHDSSVADLRSGKLMHSGNGPGPLCMSASDDNSVIKKWKIARGDGEPS